MLRTRLGLISVLALLLVASTHVNADDTPTDTDDTNWKGNLYQVLGVGHGANTEQIRIAYRKLVRKWHPDKVKDPARKKEALDKTSLINKAYEILSDPKRRKIYDLSGSEQEAEEIESDYVIESKTPSFGYANFTELAQSKPTEEDIWIIQFYRDSSSTCRSFAKVWEKLAKTVQGNVKLARVNVKTEKKLLSEHFDPMLSKNVPNIVALHPDGTWVLHDGSIRRLHLQKFAEDQLQSTTSFTQLLTQEELDAWLGRHRDHPHIIMAAKGKTPSFRELSVGHRVRRYATLAWITTKDKRGKALAKSLKMTGKGATLSVRISKEARIPPMVHKLDRPTRDELLDIIMEDRFNTLPRINGDNWDELCEPSNVKRNCVILFTEEQYANEGREQMIDKESLRLTFKNDSHIFRNTLELAHGLRDKVPPRMDLSFAWADINTQKAMYDFYRSQYPDKTIHDQGCPRLLLINAFKKHYTWYAEKVKGQPAGHLAQGIRRRHIKTWMTKFFDDELKLSKLPSEQDLVIPASEGPAPPGPIEQVILFFIRLSLYHIAIAVLALGIAVWQFTGTRKRTAAEVKMSWQSGLRGPKSGGGKKKGGGKAKTS